MDSLIKFWNYRREKVGIGGEENVRAFNAGRSTLDFEAFETGEMLSGLRKHRAAALPCIKKAMLLQFPLDAHAYLLGDHSILT